MKKKLFDLFKKEEPNDENFDDGGKFEEIVKRLSQYFTTEPEKERVLKFEDFDAAGDTYYAVVSARYKVCQRIAVAALVCFMLVSIIFNIQNVTYDNFFYLIKDFGAAAQSDAPSYETLNYDASTMQSFALYRGGLAVTSRANVSVFTSTGRRTLNNNVAYSDPHAVASDKYLLVYDMGKGGFEIFNSFAKVFSESTEYPISDAVFSDSGKFAILTRSEKHESQIIVYNGDFKKLSSYSRGLYAIDISLDKEGNRLGALYLGTTNGVATTYVVFYDLRTHEKTHEYVYEGEFPLAASFRDDGGFSIVTDSSVIMLNRRLTQEYVSASHREKSVAAVFCDGEYTAVALNNGVITDINEITVYDKNGNVIYTETLDTGVLEICASDGYVFIKNRDGAARVRMKDSFVETLKCSDGRMILYNHKTLLVCSQSKAVYLEFGK